MYVNYRLFFWQLSYLRNIGTFYLRTIDYILRFWQWVSFLTLRSKVSYICLIIIINLLDRTKTFHHMSNDLKKSTFGSLTHSPYNKPPVSCTRDKTLSKKYSQRCSRYLYSSERNGMDTEGPPWVYDSNGRHGDRKRYLNGILSTITGSW